MSDIARLGVVVEQSGIETTLKGLDAIATKMKAIETSKVSPVSTPKGGSTATASLAKEEFKLTAFKEKEAEKRLTVAEKSAAKERDIALKTNSAKEVIEARTAAYKKVLADKAESEAIKHSQQMAFIHKRSQDGILRIEEKTKADILKIREKADSDLIKQSSKLNNDLVRMSTAQSLRIAEQEAKNTSNLSAISQKELEKRITEQTRATTRIETEKAKSATRIEQIEAANQAKIQQIRERTAAYAEKLQMREELAARRSIEQQGKAYSSLADIANKARNVMAVAFAGYGITEAVGAVIKTADAMTELNARLRLVTQSSAELKQVQMDLFRVSQSSGTSIKDNSEIYFGLARATKTLGTSQKELIFLTEGLGKAAIVSGASTQSFKAAMFQLRQALESGVLRGQEFNSISEQAPRVLQAIGEGLGKTTGELRKMAGEGQLTTDVVLPALMKGLQSVNKEFDSLPTTVSRATMMVENSFSMLVARANEASKGTSTLAEVIKSISATMDSISTDSITTAMNAAGYAVMGLALVLSGKLVQALGAATIAKVAATKADIEMVRSAERTAAAKKTEAIAAQAAALDIVNSSKKELDASQALVLQKQQELEKAEQRRQSARKTADSRRELIAAEKAYELAMNANSRASDEYTRKSKEATSAAEAHAIAQDRVATSGTAAGRALSGLGTVFHALGGWVTVAIGVIWGLVTVWDNVANAAENAARKQKEAVMRGKASESIAGVTKEENEALLKVEKATVNAKKLETYLNELERSGKSKTDNEVKTVQSLLDKERAAITGWRSAAIQLENERKSKTAALQSTLANNIQDENAGYEKIVKNYQDSVKFKSDKQRQMDDLKEIDRQADDALSKLYKRPSVEDVRLGTYDSDKVAKAAAEIERTRREQRKLVMEKYAKKEGGAKKPKAPELSAGYEAALSYTQEQLEVINKMTSAQEKLLGYIKPELLERKQSLEAEKERENTVAKIAKIQEQLNKKNLGKGVAGQLQEQLKIYQQQKDAISQELVVTQALQREQNNLKIYEMDVLRIAQQKNELQKAYLDAAVATGSLSGQEARQQEQLNALKMIEIEYAGKIIEAQKTYDLMVKNRYTEEAEASKLRLDSLISERDTKLEVAKIKMYSDQEARTFEAGWRRAWGTYKDEASNASSFGEKVMGDALKGIEDAFYAMMSGIEFSFKDLWKSILSDMSRYFARQLTATLGNAIASAFSFIPSSLNFTANGQGLSVQGSQSSAGLPQITGNSTGSMLSDLATNTGRMLGFNTNPISAQSAALFTEGSQAIYGFTDSVVQSTGVIEGALNSISSNATLVPSWQYGLTGVGGGMVGGLVGDEVFGGKGYAGTGGSMGGSLGATLSLSAGAGPLGIAASVLGGSLLGGGLGSLFGDREPDERKAKFGYGASDALREEGLSNGWTGSSAFGQFRTYDDKWFSGSEMGAAMGQFIDSLESLDNAVADSLKLTSDQTQSAIEALKAIDKEYSFGMQWGDFTENSKAREQIAVDRYATILDSVEQGWGDFVRQFQGSFDQFPAFLQSIIQAMQQFRDAGGDLTRVFGQQVNSIKEFEQFAKSGETSYAAFQRLYGVFQITNRVLESLGKSTKGANLATADLRESFVRLAGGTEQLQGYLAEYYDGFYTEAERTAVVMADLQKEFDKYGATVPKTREEWRKLMESLDLSTESGQQAAVKLYQLQGAFLSVTPAIESTTDAIKDLEDQAKKTRDDLEEWFKNYLSGEDYNGLTTQGKEAAEALDTITDKLKDLADVGGNVQSGIDAMSRYIEREIPKLYEDILAPFKDLLGGKKFTSLGQDIFNLFQQITNAVKAVSEVSQKESAAIAKATTYTYQTEERFAGILDGKAISEHGTTLASIGGGDTEKNTVLAGEMATKYSASFGDIRKWFDEFAIFTDATTGTFSKIEQPLVDGLVDVFDEAKEVTSGQLSSIYETATGKDASTVSDTIDKYAQEVNLSQKSLTEAAKDAVISLDLLAQADPANAVAKAALGRDATAEERKAIEDAYNWGIANGKALDDIVSDIVNHAVNLDESIKHLGTGTLEAAKDVADFDSAVKNTANANGKNTNYSVYDEVGTLQTVKDAEQITYIDTEKAAELQAQAAAKKAAAMADLVEAFVAGVTESISGAFDDVIKEAGRIGKTDAELAITDAQASFNDAMRSTVEAVSVTVDGLAALGVTSASNAAEDLIKQFADGAITTAEQMSKAVDSVFNAVGDVEGIGAIKDKLSEAVKAAERVMAGKLFDVAKQTLTEITTDIDKIKSFKKGIDDAIFGLRTGMEGADIVGLYKQREAEIRSQLAESMQGENLDEQIDLANQLKDVIDQRYSVEFENQKRLIEFADNLAEYLRRLRVSDKSTGSVFDRLTEASRQFDEDLRLARGTGKEAEAARGRITNSSDTLLELARQFYGNSQGYTDIYNNVVGGLEGLQIDTRTEAEKALSVAQEGNDYALQQIVELQALKGTFDMKMSGLVAKQSEQVSVMQGLATQLGLSQSQILQALKDLPNSLASLVAGVNKQTITAPQQSPVSGAAPVSGWAMQAAIAEAQANGGKINYATIQAAAAESGLSYSQAVSMIRDTVINGSHATGLDYVPFDGYTAELHKGEMVLDANTSDALRKYGVNVKYSQDQMKAMMQPANDDASKQQLIQEVKRLNASLEKLRQEVALQGQSDRQQRGEIASRQEGMQKQQIVSTMRLTASNI